MAKPVVRLRAVQVAFGLATLVLVARAAQVQLLQGARYAATARAQRTERVTLPARRGTIYDRNGTPLVLTQEVFHVGVAPNELRDLEGDARTIAAALGLSLSTVRERLLRRYAYFHGPFTPLQVEPLRAIRGVHLEPELVRFRPDPDLAQTVLGRPGAHGRPASGIERALDTALTGVDGSAVVLRDGQGRRYESPSRLSAFPVPGRDVYLTIDAELQEIVEQALVDAAERYDAEGGDVVVLNPETGEILASASRSASGASSASAFTSVFEPGSTAKLFAAAALLNDGLVDRRDTVWAEEGTYQLGGRTISDDHPKGWLTLGEVIEHSSNIGIVKFAQRLTPEAHYTMLRDFGLGTPTGVEYPTESPGILKPPHQWSGTTPASLAIGYEVAVTVLQLTQAYAAIANDGILIQPTLVREVRTPAGEVAYRHVPEPVRRVVRPEAAAALRAMLHGVVYRGGSGRTAALSSYQLAGKTGTARRAGPQGYIPGSTTANFASLFPAHDPQLVMVVKFDDPKGVYARLTAAPVTRVVLERLLAARTGALDRTRLTVTQAPERLDTTTLAGGAPRVVAWPMRVEAESLAPRPVPDIMGHSLRDAARQLHRAGLRMHVTGWGEVASIDPPPGTSVLPGTLVRVTARRRGGSGRRSP